MQVCVITGASEGIGAEMATQLAQRQGAALALVLAARQTSKLDAVATLCRQHGTQVLCVPTDVGVRADCEALITQAVQQFGRIDTLINNAGVSAHALLQDVQAQHLGWYEDLMRVNLWGTVWCSHAALPHLKASRGRLVGVSSLAGLAETVLGARGPAACRHVGFLIPAERGRGRFEERDLGGEGAELGVGGHGVLKKAAVFGDAKDRRTRWQRDYFASLPPRSGSFFSRTLSTRPYSAACAAVM